MFWLSPKKKSLLLVNAGKMKFASDFLYQSKKQGLECVEIRTHTNSLIIAETSNVLYYDSNNVIDFSKIGYAFIRLKRVQKENSYFVSLLCEILKDRKIPFNDKSNIEHTMCDEKITQMVRFALKGIPIPKTIIFSAESFSNNKKTIDANISYPCVLKTNGSKGKAVWLIKDEVHLLQTILENPHEVYMAQEYIENKYDVRVVISDKEIIGAIERYSSDGFYNNVAKGGTTKIASLTNLEKNLCLRASEISDLDFSGVDFVRTNSGIKFFEVNKSPVIYGLEETLQINVPEILVKQINKKLK